MRQRYRRFAAIKKLKFGRAAGRDAITPEMLKLARDPTSRILHQLFASVWVTGKVPSACFCPRAS